jgi:hypothetical protein
MLLLKKDIGFKEVLTTVFTPLVVLPATVSGEPREASKQRANDLTVDARIAGLGVTIIESTTGELFVLASDNESQAVGFARKQIQEFKTGEQWFLLLLSEAGPILKETADRQRQKCTLTDTGFIVADHTTEITAVYAPAQRNTAWGHSLGHDVGEHL